MANTKISALAAATALAGTEAIPGVQSSANVKITPEQIKTFCRTRMDATIEGHVASGSRICGQSNRIVRASSGVWYSFFTDGAGATLYYRKSTNYGVSWATPVQIKNATVRGFAVWFDKWTPSDTGTVIHLAYYENAAHDVFYRALDTSNDSLGTEITVFAGASALATADQCISITKSKAGRILVAYDIDGGTETGFYKSDDYPVTAFTSKTDLNETTSDYYLLFPGNDADTADIWAIYWDRSADEISLKVYDDSANSWSETSIAGTMTDLATTSASPQFAGAVRNSDGHLILLAWSAADTLNADLRCWDINGAGSITEKTNVVQNSTDDQAMCAVGIDTTADTIYAFYCGKSDGSETAYSALNVYYKTSTDGGTNWGSETLLSSYSRAVSHLNCSLEFDGGEFAVSFMVGTFGAILAFNCSALT
jgi:hypothetical protein